MDSAGGYGSNRLAQRLAGDSKWRARAVGWLYPPMPTLNVIPEAARAIIRDAVFASDAVILNVGAGGAGGSGAWLWRTVPPSCRVIHLDLGSAPGISLIADAAVLPFADDSVDAIALQAVLEHVRQPESVIEDAHRVLKPGGHLYIEMPFLQGFHADPDDYQRYTLEGLRWHLRRFHLVGSGVSVGPFCTLVWLLRDGASSWTAQPLIHAAFRFAAGWLFSPLRYLDFLVRNNRVSTRLANEFYALVRK